MTPITSKMARKETRLSLKVFRGSREEAIVKGVLTRVTSVMPGFYNLVIQCSNAIEGTSFTDATIFLRVLTETRRAIQKDYEDGIPEVGLVHMKDILKMSVLEDFVATGVEGLEKRTDATKHSFLMLLGFLREKSSHEQAIQKLLAAIPHASGSKETHLMVGLAHHLFSQLVPSKMYEVDNFANEFPKECGCGCKTIISEGNTSLGTDGTWHGRVDILLNRTVAVVVLNKATDRNQEDEVTEDDDKIDCEPPCKQRAVDNCNICEEVKTFKENEVVLLERKGLNQILAEAITNSFAQANMHRTLSHFLIPTFATTSEHVTICLYDSVNDYLLHIKEELSLWKPAVTPEASKQLHVLTIVSIWLFLNFTIFTQEKLHTFIDLDKSGLHEELKEYLEYYRNTDIRQNVVSRDSSVELWKSIASTVRQRKN